MTKRKLGLEEWSELYNRPKYYDYRPQADMGTKESKGQSTPRRRGVTSTTTTKKPLYIGQTSGDQYNYVDLGNGVMGLQNQRTGEVGTTTLPETTVRPITYASSFDGGQRYIDNVFNFPGMIWNKVGKYLFDNGEPEIIQMDKPIRIERNTRNIKNILFNEFVEANNPNTIRVASDYINTNDTLLGDKNIPLSNIRMFYGIEDGKMKIGVPSDFKSTTTIIPIRNRTDRVTQIEKSDNSNIGVLRSRLDSMLSSNQNASLYNHLIDMSNTAKNKADSVRKELTFWDKLGLYTNRNKEYSNYLQQNRRYYNAATKELNSNKNLANERKLSDRINLLNNNRGIVFHGNNGLVENRFNKRDVNKMLWIDKKSGNSFFLSKPKKAFNDTRFRDSLNNILSKGEYYPIMLDNGRYSGYETESPSYNSYTAQDFWRPDNTLYVVGNKKRIGGRINLLQKYGRR